MPGKLTTALIAVIAALLVGVTYYQNEAAKLQRDVVEIASVANQQKKDLQLIEAQRQAVAAIDIKTTKELADVKSENERLRTDIASGTKRLQLNATCSKPAPKPPAPPASLMMPAPDLLTPLNGIISVSASVSELPQAK